MRVEARDDVCEPGVIVGSRFAGKRCDVYERDACVGGALQGAAARLVGDDRGDASR
jgi:hypothetical protein